MSAEKLQLDLEIPGRGTHPKRQDLTLGSQTTISTTTTSMEIDYFKLRIDLNSHPNL